jgi:tRNA(Ile)-lysidine synthase
VLNEFKRHLQLNFQNLLQQPFILACSGGVDSVVLAHLCLSLQLEFSLAHANFKLRGIESDKDEEFVHKLAILYHKISYSTTFDTVDYMNKHKVSLQVAARELRYGWFLSILTEQHISMLVTAHQADDNLETFLINLSRGTGIEGLTSIPEKTLHISRPLLPFSREEILNYAEKNKLSWREDETNKETKYLRNKIRHQIVPHLKELHPNFLNNFLKTQAYLGQTANLLENHIEALRNTIFKKEEDVIRILFSDLKTLSPLETYCYELFKPYGFSDALAITKLFESLSGKELLSTTHRLLKDRDCFLLQELKARNNSFYKITEDDSSILFPLHIKKEVVFNLEEISNECLYIDTASVKFPLVIRKAETGDYFYPFGMQGVKKLSKFFKDEKYNQIDKENQWLLCSDNEIVWVIGRRADNRFKVSLSTKKIIKFTLVK